MLAAQASFLNAGPTTAAEAKEKASGVSQPTKPSGMIPKKIEVDTNKDGIPDRFEYYEEGVLVRIEADSNFDGEIDEWGIVRDGKIVKAEKDTDGDGKADRWMTY